MAKQRKKPGKRGRPSKFTPELGAKIIAGVRAGASFTEICKAHRLAESTFYGWVSAGEFPEFSEKVQAAKVQRVIALEERVVQASKKDWRAAFKLLEVYEPKRFAPRVRVHVEQELTDALQRLKEKLAPDIFEQVLVALVEGTGGTSAERDSGDEAGADDRGDQAVQPAPAEPKAEGVSRR